jgi:hypothetical protein
MSEVGIDDIELLEVGHSIHLSGVMLTDVKKDQIFLVPFPDQDSRCRILSTLVLSEDDWKAVLRQTDIMEREVLAKDGSGLKKAILRKTTRQIEGRISWNVYRRDKYKCRYCGRDDVPLTVDHLVLWEEGGPSIEENLVSACKKCNKKRGNMQYKDWIEYSYYLEKAKNVSEYFRNLNLGLADTLDDIPRKLHVISRGKKKKRGQ